MMDKLIKSLLKHVIKNENNSILLKDIDNHVINFTDCKMSIQQLQQLYDFLEALKLDVINSKIKYKMSHFNKVLKKTEEVSSEVNKEMLVLKNACFDS